MASISMFNCQRCQSPYFTTFHNSSDHTRRLPDFDLCDKCLQRDHDAKVSAIKAELAMIARSPIALLLAEVSVLRDRLISSGQIDELRHYKAVLAVAKQITGVDDGKADQAEDPTGQRGADSPG